MTFIDGGRSLYISVAAEVLEQLDLAEGALSQDLLAEDIGHLLDGDTLAGLDVGGRTSPLSAHVSLKYPKIDTYHTIP